MLDKCILIFSVVVMTLTGTKNAFAYSVKEEMCRTPAFLSAKVSPDGSLVARVGANEAGIANVFVFPIEERPLAAQELTFFTTPEIIQFFWSADSKTVVLLKEENGTGQLSLHGFEVQSKKHISYTEKFPHVNTKVIQLSTTENKAVIGLNHRNPHFHDLYILDLNSGDLTLLLKNDTFAKFLVSDELEVILKMKINNDGSWTILTNRDEVFVDLKAEEAFQTEFISYNGKEKTVYFLDNRFSNTNQLTKKNLLPPYQEEVLGGRPDSDVDEVLLIGREPKAYASYYLQKKWHILDRSIKEDIEFLESKIGSNFEIVSLSQDGRVWIVSNSFPDKGSFFWIYQQDASTLTLLSPLSEDENTFSKMYELVVHARDGEELICYYTLPREYDQGGRVDSPLPLVVIPHGGPFKVRDKFEFNPYHQWLASCGYAVLSVNFRLSSGFGKAFVNAGNGEWGGKAHLDVIDAVEACIAQGIADKTKLAMFGGSYGGYESLAALTFTPEYFTCCVAICAPSNLKTILGSVPQFWEFTSKSLSDKTHFFTRQSFITSMGGNPEDCSGAEYLEQCSPLNHLDRIQAPLLLVHGKNDHIVAEGESRRIYESMKVNNKPVTYVLFPNEGHRFANFSNKLVCLNEAELFFSQHLDGMYTPSRKELLADSTAIFFN